MSSKDNLECMESLLSHIIGERGKLSLFTFPVQPIRKFLADENKLSGVSIQRMTNQLSWTITKIKVNWKSLPRDVEWCEALSAVKKGLSFYGDQVQTEKRSVAYLCNKENTQRSFNLPFIKVRSLNLVTHLCNKVNAQMYCNWSSLQSAAYL
jgi:hypothetical protein